MICLFYHTRLTLIYTDVISPQEWVVYLSLRDFAQFHGFNGNLVNESRRIGVPQQSPQWSKTLVIIAKYGSIFPQIPMCQNNWNRPLLALKKKYRYTCCLYIKYMTWFPCKLNFPPFGSIDSHDNMLPKCINDRLCNSFVNDAIVLQTPWSGFGVKFFNH